MRLKTKTQKANKKPGVCVRDAKKRQEWSMTFSAGNSSKMNTEMSIGIPIQETISDLEEVSFKDSFPSQY